MRKIIALSKNKNECFGDKALGLMELDNLHINVPEAIVIPSSFFFEYITLNKTEQKILINTIVSKVLEFCGSVKCDIKLFSFRCGTKNKKGQEKLLPESVLNVGLNYKLLKKLYAKKILKYSFLSSLENCLSEHIKAYNSFIGNSNDNDFMRMTLHEQLTYLFDSIYKYFSKIYQNKYDCINCFDLIIQRMVFGNIDECSLTGMCYTRNPYNGEMEDYGCFILQREGLSLGGASSPNQIDLSEMKNYNNKAYKRLVKINRILEEYYSDIRCLEFTLEGDDLYILQNTIGNRTYKIKPTSS